MERHHVVGPRRRRHFGEVLLEAGFGGGPVCDRERNVERLLRTVVAEVLDGVRRPRRVRRRIPLETQAVGECHTRVGVVREEREGAALQREARGLLRKVVGQPVLDRTRRVDVEQGGAALVQSLEHARNEVRRGRLRRLVHVHAAVRDREERELLARLGLAVLRVAVRSHVGNLTGEAGGARLSAGIRVHLRVEHHDFDRLAGCEQPREVLESDVEHRTIAAHRDDRRAEGELVIGELLPCQRSQRRLVGRRVVGACLQQLRPAHGGDVVAHLPYLRFEESDRDRRRILEQVVDPRERIRIVRPRAAPDRRAAGAVRHPHRGTTVAAWPIDVTPAQVAQRVERVGELREAIVLRGVHGHRHGARGRRGCVEIRARGEELARLCVQRFDEAIERRDVFRDARLHGRVDRRHDEMHGGLLTAPHARAVAADHRAVDVLLQQQRRQHADTLVDIRDIDEPVGRVRQALPQRPVAAKLLELPLVLPQRHERTVGTHGHAEVAALARLRIHRNREKAAAALLLRLDGVEERLRPRQRELRQALLDDGELLVRLRASIGLPPHLVGDGRVRAGERRRHRERRVLREQTLRFLRPRFRDRPQPVQRRAVRRDLDRGGQHLLDAVHEARNGRVRTLRPALTAARALLGDESGHLETNAAHVAHRPGRRGHCADGGERIGDAVLAEGADRAHLLPEPSGIADAGLGIRYVEQRRDVRHNARLLALVDRARRNGLHLIVPAADHTQVVFDDVPATMAELFLELLAYALEYLRLGRPLARDQRRRAEERTEERRTLHPVAHLDIGGFLSRDRERVEDVELDVPFEDRRARAGWQRAPERVGGEVALDHEHAAVGESVERVAVTEHIRVGRQDDVDVFELAVQQDRVVREHGVERGRLALLLRAVLRVRLDLEPEQLERGHREVLAHRDRAPAAHRMDANRGRSLRQQIGGFRPRERQLLQVRIALEEFLLPDLEFWNSRAFAHELDAEVELTAPCAVGQHVLHRRDEVAGLEVAAAETETTREELGHLVRTNRRQPGVRQRAGEAPSVLDGLRHCRADLAEDRRVHRERLVGAFQHHDAALAGEERRDEVGRKRAEHREVQHADLQPAHVAQVVGHRHGVRHDGALADDQPLRVVGAMATRSRVAAAGELRVLLERAVGERRDVVEIERALGGHALGIALLVLHHTEHRRIVQVEHFRDAAPHLTEHEALRRRRRFDAVGGIAEIRLDERRLRQLQALDDVAREESVLRANPGIERQLGNPVRDEVQVGRLLHVPREDLEEAGVVDRVIVVVAGVHVERVLGHRARRDIEHVREALADRGVERLVHVGDALPAGEVRRAKAGHRHPGRHRGRGVLALGFEEEEPATVDVLAALGHRRGPPFAHLRRWRDRIRAGRFARRGLHRHHCAAAVERLPGPGVLCCQRLARRGFLLRPQSHAASLTTFVGTRANCAPVSHTIAPVGHRSTARGSASAMRS